MSHKDVLALLLPFALEGDFQKALEVDGRSLDAAEARAEQLFLEVFPDTSVELLPDWERVCGLISGDEEPVQSRQNKVVRKLRELGDIKMPYFIALAEALGYTVEIDYDVPLMAGWAEAGDECVIEDAIYIWNISVMGQPEYVARAGDSVAGERLLWWPVVAELEEVMTDLAPAHIYFNFIYP